MPHIRILGPEDAHVFEHMAPDVFDNAIDARWAAEFLGDPRHHLAVAIDGEEVVGMASAVHYVHPDKGPELWINEVGVTPSHHRMGVGKRLMQALFEHGRTLGCTEAWVLTEHDNTAARALYGSVGGQEASTVYITFELEDKHEKKQ